MWPFSRQKEQKSNESAQGSAQEAYEYNWSADYETYLEEERSEQNLSFYENLCKFGSRFLTTSMGESFDQRMATNIRIARLAITPQEIGGTFILSTSVFFLIFLMLSLVFPSPLNIMIWAFPLFWIYYMLSYTSFRAEVTRIQSSDAALRAVLYMAMYLDMNPSLEGAIRTAANHTTGPLSRDMSKLLWDVQMKKYFSVKQALGEYMKLWREWSHDFVKSLEYLINSISRTGEDRDFMIQKAQEYIIEATYNNMQSYSRNLKGPINIIHMMGIVLPIMGLIMFPIISIFLEGQINPLYIAFGYLVMLPAFLFFLIHRQVSKRPGAYSQPDLSNVRDLPPRNVLTISFGNTSFYLPLMPIAFLVALIIMTPGLAHYVDLLNGYLSLTGKAFEEFMKNLYQGDVLIPNMFQAFTVFWGVGAGLITFFMGRSYRRMEMREMIEEIERDIDMSLTELDNSLSKNIPMERALYEVIEEYEKIGEEDSPLHHFFAGVLNRIQQMGMTFRDAVFGHAGIIQDYPSSLLRNVMRIIANSVRRGTNVLVSNVRTVNEYIQNNNRIEKLIRNLLDDTLGSMKMLAMFMAPLMCSMAASMGTMILEILYNISKALSNIQSQFTGQTKQAGGGAVAEPIQRLTQFEDVMPPTITMIIVAMYLIETTIILSYFMTGVEYGFDSINRDMTMGKYLLIASIFFSVAVLGAIVMFLPFIEDVAQVSS